SRFAERAVAEAEKAGGNLLLVLLRAPRGRVASVLAKRGARIADIRKALEPERAEPPPRPAKPPKQPKPARQHPPAPSAPPRPRAAERRPVDPEEAEAPRERRLPPHLDTKRRSAKQAGKIPWS